MIPRGHTGVLKVVHSVSEKAPCGTQLNLTSHCGVLNSGCFLQISRTFRREGDSLVQIVGMAAESTPLTEHLVAHYQLQS